MNLGQKKHCTNCRKVEDGKRHLSKKEAQWYMGKDEAYLCLDCCKDYKREKAIEKQEGTNEK